MRKAIAFIILILLTPINYSEREIASKSLPSKEDVIGFLLAIKERAGKFGKEVNIAEEIIEKTGRIDYVFNDTSLEDAIKYFYNATGILYNESKIKEFVNKLNFPKNVEDAIALIMFSYSDAIMAIDREEQIDALFETIGSIRKSYPILSNYSLNESIGDDYKKIIFGGIGNDTLNENYSFIIDFGGSDYYYKRNNSFILDLHGNDEYINQSAFYGINIVCDLEGDDKYNDIFSYAGINFFLDLKGDDKYIGKIVTSYEDGICSLIDIEGNDIYEGKDYTESFAKKSFSMLVDFNGDDIFNASSYSQASSIEGLAILIDFYGNDFLKATDQSQAFANGGLSKSISLLINLEGDDYYEAGDFSQGYAEQGGLAIFFDFLGQDNYMAGKFSQSSAIFGIAGMLDVDGRSKFKSGLFSQGHRLGGLSFFMNNFEIRGNEGVLQIIDYLNTYFGNIVSDFL